MYDNLHVTTDVIVIKNWIESRRGIPAIMIDDQATKLAVFFGEIDEDGWLPVTVEVFVDTMISDDLVFVFENDRNDDSHARYFHFMRWEEQASDVPEVKVCECGKSIISEHVLSVS